MRARSPIGTRWARACRHRSAAGATAPAVPYPPLPSAPSRMPQPFSTTSRTQVRQQGRRAARVWLPVGCPGCEMAAVAQHTALTPATMPLPLFSLLPLCSHRPAVMIVDGKMQYLFDEKGRRYLDVSADAGRLGRRALQTGCCCCWCRRWCRRCCCRRPFESCASSC